MFLKEMTRWRHGERVRPVDLPEPAPLRERFSLAVHQQRVLDIETHWKSLVFSGRDVPPPKKATEVEVLAYVAAQPGAIGYVSADMPLPEGVKRLDLLD
jgi:hypothetical protein